MILGVIMAAGCGRKFWPYSTVRNKAAFPIAGEAPVRRLARQLTAAGAEGLAVVVGPGAPSVRAALRGMEARVRFVEQGAARGTAAAVLDAVDALDPGATSVVVAVAGDVVTGDATIAALVREAREGQAVAAAVTRAAEPGASPLACDVVGEGVAAIEGRGRDGAYALGGLYVLRPAAVAALRANPGIMTHVPVGGMPPPEAEIAETLAGLLDAGGFVSAVACRDFLVDLDRPWQILQAAGAVLAEKSRALEGSSIAPGARVSDRAHVEGRLVLGAGAEVGPGAHLRGDVWLADGAKVTSGAIVHGPVWIGPRSVVRDYALVGEKSILGAGAVCGHGAEFCGVLLDGAYLYHYCEITGVVGASVDIGAATVCGTLRFDDRAAEHAIDGWRETPLVGANASYLGDYSRTGVNAVLMPGVKVGAYSCVGPGVILYEDLPERELLIAKQEVVRRTWGPERYGW